MVARLSFVLISDKHLRQFSVFNWHHHINVFVKNILETNPEKIRPPARLFADLTAFGSEMISYWHNIVTQGQLPTLQR